MKTNLLRWTIAKFPTENRVKAGDFTRIGPNIYEVVFRIGDYHLLKKYS